MADAYSTGISGGAAANATSNGGAVSSLHVQATGPALSAAATHTEAFANNAASPRSESLAAGIQAAAYATANPNASDTTSSLASSGNVAAAFNGTSGVLGLITMSFQNLPLGSSTAFKTETDWSVTLADVPDLSQQLILGLTGASSSGDGTVVFAVNLNNGDPAISQSFSHFAAADAYFTNAAFDLGTIGGDLTAGQSLSVDISLTVVPTTAGATFDPGLAFGTPAPEPAALWILALAGAGLPRRPERCARH